MASETDEKIFFQPLAHGTQFAMALVLRDLVAEVKALKGDEWMRATVSKWVQEMDVAYPDKNSEDRRAAEGLLTLVTARSRPATR
jgi:hypothetical protein